MVKKVKPPKKEDTSWGKVSSWYDNHLQKSTTYHETVVYPNLLRLLGNIKNSTILDLACGQGIFSERLADISAKVVGVDLGRELIDIAKIKGKSKKNLDYFVTTSDDLYMLKDASMDIVLISLAIQNIEHVKETFKECARVLKKSGKLFIVMNHPAFRNPKQTSWEYDEKQDIQFRRVDEYLSESKVAIDMNPGSVKEKKFTYSFHRPLQYYSKLLEKSGFLIKRIEEWESPRVSEKGKREKAENKARKEIPLFLCIEAVQ